MQKEEIFKKLGIENATEEQKNEILGKILETVEYRFAGIVDDLLNDSQQVELNKLTDGDNPALVIGWLKRNVPKAGELYEAILSDHIDEVIENSK